MTTRICVSILPKKKLEAFSLIKIAEKAKADLIEVRLDCIETSRPDLTDLVKSAKIPLIATNKLPSEKGYFAGTEAERQQTLFNAAENGFEYIDVDLSSPNPKETINKLKVLGAKPIVSFHKFDGALSVPEMKIVLEQEIAIGADVCKIIVTAKKNEDNLTALNFVSTVTSKAKLVCFCMGELGKLSRLLSPMFGAFFTFASLQEGSETAAGQMTIQEMRAAYDLLELK
ncbi:MAG: type I 3-dehydroquinate dehydratase [Candidatus Bathyarchaeia archaeon]